MNGFTIELDTIKQHSTLESKTLTQYIDKDLLSKLIKCYKKESEWSNETIRTMKKILLQCTNNTIKVSYEFSKNNPYKLGRYFPVNGISLGNLERSARHTLCKDTYVDIDIVCSLQSILVGLCVNTNYDKSYDAIKYYVEHRDEKLKEVMDFYGVDRDTSKELFTCLSNGGSFISWCNKYTIENRLMIPYIDTYKKQCDSLCEHIKECNPELIKEVDRISKEKGKEAWNGSYIAYWYQTYERAILDQIIYFLVEKKDILDGFIPCHDGIMIHMKDYKDGLEKEIEAYIKETTYLNLTFIKKPMDEFINLPNELPITENPIELELDQIIKNPMKYYEDNLSTDKRMVDIFFRIIKDKYIATGKKELYYTNDKNLWVQDTSSFTTLTKDILTIYTTLFNKILNRLTEIYKGKKESASKIEHDSLVKDTDAIKKKLEKLYEKDEAMIQSRIKYIEGKNKDNIIKDIITAVDTNEYPFDNKYNLFALNDKVIDMTDVKNIVVRDIKKEDMIHLTTGYNYEEPNKEKQEKIMDVLRTIQSETEVLEDLLWLSARPMYGLCPEKLIIMNGSGGNGKGLINTFNQYVYGSYFARLTPELLTKTIPSGGCPELANLKGKRYLNCPEVDAEYTLNSATVKTITGGDDITARKLYSNKDLSFKINCTTFVECNGKLKFSTDPSNGLNRRIIDFEFLSSTTENPMEVNKSHRIYLRNGELKTTEYVESIRCQLLHIYLDRLKSYGINKVLSETVQEDTKKYLDTEVNIFLSWYADNYDKSPVPLDDKNWKSSMITSGKYCKAVDVFEDFKKSEDYKNMERHVKANFKRKTVFAYLSKIKPIQWCEVVNYNVGETRHQVKNVLIGYYRNNQNNVEECLIEEKSL